MNYGFDPQQQLREQMQRDLKRQQSQMQQDRDHAMWQDYQDKRRGQPAPAYRPHENCVAYVIKAPFRLVGWFITQIFLLIRNLILIAIALAIIGGLAYLALMALSNS